MANNPGRGGKPPGASDDGLHIAFIHPDLGLGGAERLVVDAATELVQQGHRVDMFTAYYNPNRCFEETKTGGFYVYTAGGWFPRHILGITWAVCAYTRCVLVALHIVWRCYVGVKPHPTSSRRIKSHYDVIIADQVSVVVPVLQWLLPSVKVLFYCHFPDLLLAKHDSTVKRVYRAPLDYVEQATTGSADLVLVNSKFTRGVFASTFTRLAARGVNPQVLYPAVPIPAEADLRAAEHAWMQELDPDLVAFIQGGPTFLSINRFERKKGIGLALEALHELLVLRASTPGLRDGAAAGGEGEGPAAGSGKAGPRGAAPPAADEAPGSFSFSGLLSGAAAAVGEAVLGGGGGGGAGAGTPRLVIAGGYDARITENVEHLSELQLAADQMDLRAVVRFVPSFTDRQRTLLLAACRAVVYTPQHEHFGIVPLEAMAAGRPVVAVNNGGPVESVGSAGSSAGFLCEPTPAAFAQAFAQLLDPRVAARMGEAARHHVEAAFSREAFGRSLDGYVRGLLAPGKGAGGQR